MNLLKKCFILFYLLAACNIYAQRPFRWPHFLIRTDVIKTDIERFLSSGFLTPALQKDISAALHNSMLESYQTAQNIQNSVTTPLLCNIHPSKKITGPDNVSFTESALAMYPQIASIVTTDHLANIFLIKNNNLALYEQQRMRNWLSSLTPKIPTLKQETAFLMQPAKPDEWLAAQIPSQTKTLFLGELHRKENIKHFVTQLLQRIADTQPEGREIFLFTEFLPSEFLWSSFHNPASHPYGSVFQAAADKKISVIGLEPPYVQENILFLEFKNKAGQKERESIWSSPEGVRLRNQHYTELLKKYRMAFPNALFIVYAGASHVQYNSFLSVSGNFPAQETFVVTLYPEKYLSRCAAKEIPRQFRPIFSSLISQFDIATGGKFPQKTLYWQTKDSALTAGFDVQLKLPEALP